MILLIGRQTGMSTPLCLPAFDRDPNSAPATHLKPGAPIHKEPRTKNNQPAA